MRKTIFVLLIAIMSLTLSLSPVLAQDTDTGVVNEFTETTDTGEDAEIIDPEEVTAEELEIREPGRFSWLGNIIRNAQIAVTRDPIKKSELELKKASEQLLRVRKTVQEKPNDPRLQERLEEMDGKYATLIGKINTRVENYKNENPEAPKLKDFLDKYTSQQLKHQEILKLVETRVPEKIMEKIQANRIIHLEKFGEVMNKLQTKEELKERLQRAVENVGLETGEVRARVENQIERRANRAGILEELEEKVPAVKEQMREIRSDSIQLFQELKVKQEEIQQNRKEFRQDVKQDIKENMDELKQNPEARQELKQEILEDRRDVIEKNQEIRQEAREQIQENNPGVGERIMNVFRKTDKTQEPIKNSPVAAPKQNCKNLCGDGKCQEIVCLAIDCPCAETPESCPQDCK